MLNNRYFQIIYIGICPKSYRMCHACIIIHEYLQVWSRSAFLFSSIYEWGRLSIIYFINITWNRLNEFSIFLTIYEILFLWLSPFFSSLTLVILYFYLNPLEIVNEIDSKGLANPSDVGILYAILCSDKNIFYVTLWHHYVDVGLYNLINWH